MHVNLCKNCTATFEGNFCSNCSQKTNTKRLDWQYVWDELKYTFLHINSGFLFTCKELFLRPGTMVREFLEGKCVKHYKPILLVFVLAGATSFLIHLLPSENMTALYFKKNDPKYIKQISEITTWIKSHYSLIEIAFLPLTSLSTWFSFRCWGYNFKENIIINSFVAAQRLIFGIIIFPINYYLQDTSFVSSAFIGLLGYLFTIFLYCQLYNQHAVLKVILKLLLSLVYSSIIVILVSVFIGFTFAFIKIKYL